MIIIITCLPGRSQPENRNSKKNSAAWGTETVTIYMPLTTLHAHYRTRKSKTIMKPSLLLARIRPSERTGNRCLLWCMVLLNCYWLGIYLVHWHYSILSQFSYDWLFCTRIDVYSYKLMSTIYHELLSINPFVWMHKTELVSMQLESVEVSLDSIKCLLEYIGGLSEPIVCLLECILLHYSSYLNQY